VEDTLNKGSLSLSLCRVCAPSLYQFTALDSSTEMAVQPHATTGPALFIWSHITRCSVLLVCTRCLQTNPFSISPLPFIMSGMAFSLHRTAAGVLLPLVGKAAAGSRPLVLPGKAATGGVFAGKPAVTGNTRSAAPVVYAAWDSEHAAAYDGSRGDKDKVCSKLPSNPMQFFKSSCSNGCFPSKIWARRISWRLRFV
jgi:hypothetical protein